MSQPIYTTGDIAKICHVTARTVTKWCDSGRLRCFRIPGSHERRIIREHLEMFCREYSEDGVYALLESHDAALAAARGETP